MKRNFLTFITLLILVGGFTGTQSALAEKENRKSGLVLFVDITHFTGRIGDNIVLEFADLQAAYSLKYNPLSNKAGDFLTNGDDENFLLIHKEKQALTEQHCRNKENVQKKIKLVIESIAKREGAIAVITCYLHNISHPIGVMGALYRDPELDITKEVIETVNKEYLAEGK